MYRFCILTEFFRYFFYFIRFCVNLQQGFIQGMYIGVGKVFFNSVGFFDLLIPIPAIVVCTLAYLLGIRYCEGFFSYTPSASKRAKDSRYQ